jgi:hypothetical protein
MQLAKAGGLIAAFLVGTLLVAVIFRLPSTRAQNKVSIVIDHVMTSAGTTTSVAGSKIVGFSCVSKGEGLTDCYIASLP